MAIVLVAMVLLATFATILMDIVTRNIMDQRLSNMARIATSFIQVTNGHIVLEPDDQTQFLSILGVQYFGRVIDRSGKAILGNAVVAPRRPPKMYHLWPLENVPGVGGHLKVYQRR